MERRALKIPGCIDMYEVTEDGQVYSIRFQDYLKPSQNSVGYTMYTLAAQRGQTHDTGKRIRVFSAHRLVAMLYLPPPPTRWHIDVHHKDNDKTNNHHSNLKWTTRSENILRSWRETDRVSPWKGKKRGPHSPETITLMSTAHEKSVYVEISGERKEYGSIQDMLGDLGIYRKAFNRSVNTGTPYKGMSFGYINS